MILVVILLSGQRIKLRRFEMKEKVIIIVVIPSFRSKNQTANPPKIWEIL